MSIVQKMRSQLAEAMKARDTVRSTSCATGSHS